MSAEEEIFKFFDVLEASLNGLREVRSVYNEQVAFEFNSTSFFGPNERKTSEILAFFLNPMERHGQKGTFLRLFIEKFELKNLSLFLENPEKIKVKIEDPTAEGRLIDITISFNDGEYVIGIENKIGTAADQPAQVKDYAKDLRLRVKENSEWTLFYLTPRGSNPSENSIEETHRKNLADQLKMISYDNHIINLFGQFELACKAENVRAFLKDFRQYLRQRYVGETIMGETEFTKTCIEKHPEILAHLGSLNEGANQLLSDFRRKCYEVLHKKLGENERSIRIDPAHWQIKRPTDATLHYGDDMLKSLSLEVNTPLWIKINSNYIGIPFRFPGGVSEDESRRSLIDSFRKSMKSEYPSYAWKDWWELGQIALPEPDLNFQSLRKYYECPDDERGDHCEQLMEPLYKFIVTFINNAESYAASIPRATS
jgi:PD-(D/E)XK nuclease superfamily